jgi:hypothetical protein
VTAARAEAKSKEQRHRTADARERRKIVVAQRKVVMVVVMVVQDDPRKERRLTLELYLLYPSRRLKQKACTVAQRRDKRVTAK